MKKKVKTLTSILLGTIGLIIPACSGANTYQAPHQDEEMVDPISYEEVKPKLYDNPDRVTRDEGGSKVVTPDVVKLHYHNDDNNCLSRRFYTWVTGIDGVERKPEASTWTATDMEITLNLSEIEGYAGMPSIFFIMKFAGTWAGQSEDTELPYALWQDYIVDGVLEIWTIPGEGTSIEMYGSEEETKLPKITTAKFTDFKTIHCTSSIDLNDDGSIKKKWVAKKYELYAFDKNYFTMSESAQVSQKKHYLFKSGVPSGNEFDIKFNYTAKINVQYMIESVFEGFEDKPVRKIVVSCENLYENQRFEKFYTYSGNDLGVTYTSGQTTFKVWSPIAALVDLNLYESGTPTALDPVNGNDNKRVYHMTYSKGGVWTAVIAGDIKGKFYTYSVTHSAGTVEAMDPYAKACGVNGVRGYVYDKASSEANPTGWDLIPTKWDGVSGYDINSPQDLSIYEIHIRDLTMDSTWISNKNNKRGTYSAFSESGTKLTMSGKTVTTGFDHIEELGVKAIQLLPVFDQDNDERPDKMKFNWGYNPLNYNCVDGGYSSDPTDPLARIVEYKELIRAYASNANHTRVIMDVVYNHVSSASASCFTKIMPKYYFRYDANWAYLDGSGCSNEVKSDATMMRKYIVDSLVWWATEYKVKGFRFDLMGLIDTWTLREAKETLYKLDPDIVIYGEGWTSGGYHGKTEFDSHGNLINGGAENNLIYSQLYASQSSPGQVGGFNNGGRDNLRGGNDDGYSGFPYPTWGFMSQGSGDVGDKSSSVITMMKGANPWAGANPAQTINYASCHDNYTVWDQFNFALASSHNSTTREPSGAPSVSNLVQATIAAHASVFMSNGAAFIQGGEELYRTKSYSYCSAEQLAKLTAGGADAVVRPFPTYVHCSEDPEVIQATSEVMMYGSIITHNSYKSPDEVNSFKWDRKISVNGTSTYEYNETWQKLVKAHNDFYKIDYATMWESGDTSNYNAWTLAEGNYGACVIGAWMRISSTQGYGFIFANRAGGTFNWGSINVASTVFSSGGVTRNGDNITLAPYACVCYKLNG